MRIISLLISFIFALGLTPAFAEQPKAKIPGCKTPVNSVDGILYPKGKVGIIFKHVSLDKDTLYDGDDKVASTKEKEIRKTVLAIRYGLIDNLELKLKVPYVDLDLTRSPSTPIENSGLGDIILHTRYQFLSQKRGDKFFMFGGLGIKMPTGETDATTNGIQDPSTMLTGSGSWDPSIDMGITKALGKFKLNSYLSYTFTTEGDNDYEWGDTLLADVSAVYDFNKYLDFELELNSIWKEKDQKNGLDQNNTGGNQIYITPGIHFKFLKKSHFALGVPITIHRDLHGRQLSDDYRIVAKLAFVF